MDSLLRRTVRVDRHDQEAIRANQLPILESALIPLGSDYRLTNFVRATPFSTFPTTFSMSSSTPTDHPVKVPFFKKGKSRPSTVVRKKSPSPDPLAGSKSRFAAPPNSNEDTGKSSVVLPTKKASANLLSAGTKRTVSQRDTLNDDDTEANAQNGHDVKWSSSSTSHINAALDILAGDEAEELLAKRRKKEIEDAGGEEEIPDDGLYRGQAAYKSHLKKNTEVPKAMRIGPQRNTSSTIRTVTIVDYQPDVCKDYKGMHFSVVYMRTH